MNLVAFDTGRAEHAAATLRAVADELDALAQVVRGRAAACDWSGPARLRYDAGAAELARELVAVADGLLDVADLASSAVGRAEALSERRGREALRARRRTVTRTALGP